MDGQCVHADRHRLGRDDGELLAVRAVLVEFVDHLGADGTRPRARELDDLLSLGRIRVDAAELAAAVTEKNDEVIRLALFQLLQGVKSSEASLARIKQALCVMTPRQVTHLQNSILLAFIHFASQTTVSYGIDDDRLVGLGTWLFEQFRTL